MKALKQVFLATAALLGLGTLASAEGDEQQRLDDVNPVLDRVARIQQKIEQQSESRKAVDDLRIAQWNNWPNWPDWNDFNNFNDWYNY